MKKGFTLIELLIVIGIISILATAVVLVLNPAQLLAQARDSTRISDLSSVKSAIGLYLATATSTLAVGSTGYSTASTTCGFSAACTLNPIYTVSGSGWVSVNLTQTSGGSSLASLPKDPTNGTCAPAYGTSTICQYTYKGGGNTDLTFELNTVLESAKYSSWMASSTDGGNNDNYYEIGTDPGLDL